MKQNFTVRQGALDGVEAFLSVAQHRSFRRAAAEVGVTSSAISQAVCAAGRNDRSEVAQALDPEAAACNRQSRPTIIDYIRL
jgi:Bacterial regulatory helix-turn-helix protein, lysR family